MRRSAKPADPEGGFGERRMARWPSGWFGAAMASPGYLAIWTAMHVTGAAFCAAQLAGIRARVEVFLAAFGTALGVYILDRVKIRESWRDPADRAAHPARERFLRPRARLLRGVSAAAIAGAAVAAARLHPAAAALPLGAVIGASLYAARSERGGAVKDRLILKNGAVAAGVAALAGALIGFDLLGGGGAESGSTSSALGIGAASLFVAMQVFGDAALCDVPDTESDRAHGTRTIATRFGAEAPWRVAIALGLLALGYAWVGAGAGILASPAWWRWGVLLIMGTLLLRFAPDRVLRDLADLRMPLVSVVILIWGAF